MIMQQGSRTKGLKERKGKGSRASDKKAKRAKKEKRREKNQRKRKNRQKRKLRKNGKQSKKRKSNKRKERKGKKRTRKQQKRKEMKRKEKKLRRRTGKKNVESKCGRSLSRAINETCITNILAMYAVYANQMKNFEKQFKRIRAKNKTSNNKGGEQFFFLHSICNCTKTHTQFPILHTLARREHSPNTEIQKYRNTNAETECDGNTFSGKKGAFNKALERLVEQGGGNKSNLTCQVIMMIILNMLMMVIKFPMKGSASNEGAKQLKNLTDFLTNCSTKIKVKERFNRGDNETFFFIFFADSPF